MLKSKRIRVFAGPNGSGKSTLFDFISDKYKTGFYVNADELSKQLNSEGFIDLQPTGIITQQKDLEVFSKTKEARSLLTKAIVEGNEIKIKIRDNFIVDKEKNSNAYVASYVASFIRLLLYKNNKTFSFETVMSHASKIEELNNAKQNGYQIYLYYVCTDNADINVSRVSNRIEKGGHPVNIEKIRSRFNNTLLNLYPVILLSYRCYLFDNSGKEIKLIAEIFQDYLELKTNKLPNWFIEYVLPHYSIEP